MHSVTITVNSRYKPAAGLQLLSMNPLHLSDCSAGHLMHSRKNTHLSWPKGALGDVDH